jgi:hypothetical protein
VLECVECHNPYLSFALAAVGCRERLANRGRRHPWPEGAEAEGDQGGRFSKAEPGAAFDGGDRAVGEHVAREGGGFGQKGESESEGEVQVEAGGDVAPAGDGGHDRQRAQEEQRCDAGRDRERARAG